MKIKANEYLCLEGEKGNSLFVIKSGILEGTSKTLENSSREHFVPGSITGELSLLENAPRDSSLRALEDSEIEIIEQDQLKEALNGKPGWLQSILTFLTGRNRIARENKKKGDQVQALPPLLYIMRCHMQRTGSVGIPLDLLHQEIFSLNNTSESECDRLLQTLQGLDVLKIHDTAEGKFVQAESPQIIPMLYEALLYRATRQKVSPNILSMTDQMVLTAFIEIAKESKAPLHDGFCTISTDLLKAECKKSMHGFTLTTRVVAPLVQRELLHASSTFDIHAPLENYDFFYADFEKIMDLLELNRVFPLLDKKLVM